MRWCPLRVVSSSYYRSPQTNVSPVLKHGPRSSDCVQVKGAINPKGAKKLKFLEEPWDPLNKRGKKKPFLQRDPHSYPTKRTLIVTFVEGEHTR